MTSTAERLGHLSDEELETKLYQLLDSLKHARGDRDKVQREIGDIRAERDRRLPE